MPSFRKIFVAVLAAFLVARAGTCLADQAGFQVTDMAGRKVTIAGRVSRVVCLGPGALRLIVYLQAQDRVVGVEAMEKRFPSGRPYWMAHPELHGLPVIGPGGAAAINKKPDLEALLKVAPDLVVATYMDAALADQIQKVLAKPVVVLSYGSLATFDRAVFASLRLAGRILGCRDRADKVVALMESMQADLRRCSSKQDPGRQPGAYVGGLGYKGSHGILSTDRDYLPLKWLKAVNLAATVPAHMGSHVFLDKEDLLKLDPRIIFIDGGGLELVKQDFQRRPGFYRSMQAFAAGRVYLLFPFNYYTTNIETAYVDAYAVGKILFPDRFGDLNLEAKADQIYTRMVGRPLYSRMADSYGQLGRVPGFLKP